MNPTAAILRLAVITLTAFALVITLGGNAGAAPPPVEWNQAQEGNIILDGCVLGPYQGPGGEWEPDYNACFRKDGHEVWVADNKRDAKAAVAYWKFFPRQGRGYADAPTRQGVCIFSGGVRDAGRCNKKFSGEGALWMKAGYRKGQVNRVSELVLGGSWCYYLNDGGVFVDASCILVNA